MLLLLFSCCPVWLFVTPWTVACQALSSMGFPRQEYWSGLPFPSPGDLPNPTEPTSPALQADSWLLSHQRSSQIIHSSILSTSLSELSPSCPWKWKWSCSVMSVSSQPHGLQPARLLCPCGFSRPEYWSGLPFSSPGNQTWVSGIASRFFTLWTTREA